MEDLRASWMHACERKADPQFVGRSVFEIVDRVIRIYAYAINSRMTENGLVPYEVVFNRPPFYARTEASTH